MNRPLECEFCEIVKDPSVAAVVYEDADTLAFLDITAVTPGHTLVIPKIHTRNLWSIGEVEFASVARTVLRLSHVLRETFGPEGLTIFQANEASGWQDVFHMHVHLVPRMSDDGLRRPWVAERRGMESLREAQTAVLQHLSDR